MTDQEMIIAIAKFEGWHSVHCGGVSPVGNPPCCKSTSALFGRVLPDYLNDLNAMHEVEKKLTCKQENAFVNILWCVVNPELAMKWDSAPMLAFFDYIHATARQRATALLKTIGKWIES